MLSCVLSEGRSHAGAGAVCSLHVTLRVAGSEQHSQEFPKARANHIRQCRTGAAAQRGEDSRGRGCLPAASMSHCGLPGSGPSRGLRPGLLSGTLEGLILAGAGGACLPPVKLL